MDTIDRTAYDPRDPRDARGGFSETAIRAQLRCLQQSRTFARARRLQVLLAYLVEHSLSGSDRDLHETIIGIEHFRRGNDFDCQGDTIVRVSARRLRDRLREYYREEGAADPIRLEIPKGRYRVVFHPGAPPSSPPQPLPSSDRRPPDAAAVPIACAEPGAVEAERRPPAHGSWRGRRPFSPAVAALVVVTAVVGLLASGARNSDKPGATEPPVERERATASAMAVEEHLALAHFYYGRRAEGDVSMALEHFERALALDKDVADAWVGVAKCVRVLWLEEGQLSAEDALVRQLAALRTALSLDPFHAEAHVREATLHRRWLKDPEAAARSMALALRYGSREPEVLSMVAGYRGLQGDLKGAIETLQSAVTREPTNALYRVNLGSYLLQAGRLEAAAKELQTALRLNPRQPRVELDLIEALLGLERGPEARAVVAAMAPGPEAVLAAALLGASYGEFERATATLEELAASRVAPEILLAIRGYLFLGDTELALSSLEQNRDLLLSSEHHALQVMLDLYGLLQSPSGRRARGHPDWDRWWQSAGLAVLGSADPYLVD